MAAELKDDFQVDAKLIEGSKGIFDVTVDGRLVYSKFKTHVFPGAGEVSGLIKGQ